MSKRSPSKQGCSYRACTQQPFAPPIEVNIGTHPFEDDGGFEQYPRHDEDAPDGEMCEHLRGVGTSNSMGLRPGFYERKGARQEMTQEKGREKNGASHHPKTKATEPVGWMATRQGSPCFAHSEQDDDLCPEPEDPGNLVEEVFALCRAKEVGHRGLIETRRHVGLVLVVPLWRAH